MVVTGAASGIGQALATQFADAGAHLHLIDIDVSGLTRLETELRTKTLVTCYPCDLTDPSAISTVAKRLQRVDVLVNNAGRAVIGPFHRAELVHIEDMLAVNLLGPMRLTHALLPQMYAQQSGHIVFVASYAGLVGAPAMVGYSTSKFGVVGFAESLRYELESEGIGVSVVCPGYVRTNLHASTRYDNQGFKAFLDGPGAHRGLSAVEVANRTLSAIETQTPLIVLGNERLGWFLKRLSPALAYRAAKWVAERVGIASWVRPQGN